jgi:hypothetical protein
MAVGAVQAEAIPRAVLIEVQAGLAQLSLEEADRTTLRWEATTTLPPESLIDLLEASGRLRRSVGPSTVTDSRLELDWRGQP